MKKKKKYWSQTVTRYSHAMDLEEGVFTWKNPEKIAKSLAQSANVSNNLKSTPFRSAMSMLNFYINRAGKKLSLERKKTLNKTKEKLRSIFKRNLYEKKASQKTTSIK